jgi:hypothetical protein
MTDRRSGRPRRGLDPDYLRRIEAGEVVPTPQELDLLGEVYELTDIEYRFLRLLATHETHGPAPIPQVTLTAEHRRRVDARWLSPAGWCTT